MQHTLVAVFDNRRDAEQAMDELLASGFSREEVRVSLADPTGQTDSLTGSKPSVSPDEGIGASIKHFFNDIFGADNSEHVQKYQDAVSRGHHVLTVTAADEPEIERAADIVERHGPVDIDEKSAQWGGGAAVAQPESMRMSGAGGMQQSASLQSEPDRGLFQQQSLQDPVPHGTTYQETMGTPFELDTTQGAGMQGGTRQASAGQGSQQRDTSAAAIPVVEEQLRVGKREVQRGGVRVFSRIVETPVSESIGLREEHVNVERHAVDRPVTPGDSTLFQEQTIELRETAEEAVVEKSARVVEEVVIGKEVSERQEQISDTLRHTEVEVEQLGAKAGVLPLAEDESYYRTHWSSNYGSAGGAYEDYAPAYSYGSAMARSDQYRGRPWTEVESDMKSDWESRHAGHASTWEKMKAAIRHGWERVTS